MIKYKLNQKHNFKISRKWSMPNKNTFKILPIKNLIQSILDSYNDPLPIDPFCNNSIFKSKCISNDIDPNIIADYNMDAIDFLKLFGDNEVDIVFFDPPYSTRQVSECYKKVNKIVNRETTQTSFWTNLKTEIKRITKINATVISCGWNSGGIGIKNGFQIEEILLVAHGGWHNDTIITIERKIK